MYSSDTKCKTVKLPDGDQLVIEQNDRGIHYKSLKVTNKFPDNIDHMRKQEMFCDVTLVADHTEARAHKSILAATSLFFYTSFSGLLGPTETEDRIVLDGVHRFVLSPIVIYIYTGNILITEENVEHLLRASNKLHLAGIFNACCHFMQEHLNSKNVFYIVTFAQENNCLDLLDRADIYIREHFSEISKTEEYLELPRERLYKMIKSDGLEASEELDVFRAVLAWIKHNLKDRRQYLSSFMEHVRFPWIPLRELIEKVEGEPLIEANALCRSYLKEARKYHFLQTLKDKDANATPRTKIRRIWGNPTEDTAEINGESPYNTSTESETESDTESDHPDLEKNSIVTVGRNDQNILTMETFDVEERTWVEAPQSFHRWCRVHSVLLNTGEKVYMIGGYGTDEKNNAGVDVYIYRLEKWVKCNDMLEGREAAAAVELNDDIYVTGGYANGRYLRTCEKLDMRTKNWIKIADMVKTRTHHSMFVLDGKIYAVGGMNGTRLLTTVECYTPETNKWRVMSKMAVPNIVSSENSLYASEKYLVQKKKRAMWCCTRVYPGTSSFSHVYKFVALTALDGKLYAIGGQNEYGWVTNVQVIDINDFEPQWSLLSRMKTPAAGQSAVAANGLIYVVGGRVDGEREAGRPFQVYDPRTDTWKILPENATHGRQFVGAAKFTWTS